MTRFDRGAITILIIFIALVSWMFYIDATSRIETRDQQIVDLETRLHSCANEIDLRGIYGN